jgi:hypothetical protein
MAGLPPSKEVADREGLSGWKYRILTGDFQHWKDHDAYKKTFERVVRDLTMPL